MFLKSVGTGARVEKEVHVPNLRYRSSQQPSHRTQYILLLPQHIVIMTKKARPDFRILRDLAFLSYTVGDVGLEP